MDRCWSNVPHLVSREEAAEMQGVLGKAVADNPLAHLANHLHVIIHTRDDEVRQFYPHPCIMHGENSVKDRLKMTTANLLIDIVAETLQVDIGCIEIRQQVFQRFLADITCCDENVP